MYINEMNIKDLNDNIQTTILEARKKCCLRLSEEEKLSSNIKCLMKQRRETIHEYLTQTNRKHQIKI